MAEISKDGTGYIGYEYKDKIVSDAFSALYRDNYPCFGWELVSERAGRRNRQISLRFRRDRKICNKAELTRLQRSFDGCIAEIAALERAKTSMPAMWAAMVAVIGTAFMAGSVFAVSARPPRIALCILLAIPAFIGWIVPYFLFRYLSDRKTIQITPMIEEKYDELYEICAKGSRLLI